MTVAHEGNYLKELVASEMRCTIYLGTLVLIIRRCEIKVSTGAPSELGFLLRFETVWRMSTQNRFSKASYGLRICLS